MSNKNEKFMYQVADKARMSEQTAHKYLKTGKLPSQLKKNTIGQLAKIPLSKIGRLFLK